jgi:hypothetical protein
MADGKGLQELFARFLGSDPKLAEEFEALTKEEKQRQYEEFQKNTRAAAEKLSEAVTPQAAQTLDAGGLEMAKRGGRDLIDAEVYGLQNKMPLTQADREHKVKTYTDIVMPEVKANRELIARRDQQNTDMFNALMSQRNSDRDLQRRSQTMDLIGRLAGSAALLFT